MGRKAVRYDGHEVVKSLFEEFDLPYTEEDLRGSNSLAHKYNRGDDIRGMFLDRYQRDIATHSPDKYWDSVKPSTLTVEDDYGNETAVKYLPDLHTFQAQIAMDAGEDLEDFTKLQTRFVNELYGYETYDQDDEATDNIVKGAIEQGLDRDSWGLDIKRDIGELTKDDGDAYYQAMTKGKVDYDYYNKGTLQDNKFLWAHKQIGKELDDVAGISSIAEIRAANKLVYKDILKEQGSGELTKPDWMKSWTGKYEPKFNLEDAPKYEATELDVSYEGYDSDSNTYASGTFKQVAKKSYDVGALQINPGNVSVERPPNLSEASWKLSGE